jgi:hypothetical protein
LAEKLRKENRLDEATEAGKLADQIRAYTLAGAPPHWEPSIPMPALELPSP